MRLPLRLGLGMAVPAIIVVVWAVAADVRLVSPDALPPPGDVLDAGRQELATGTLLDVLSHSVVSAVLGWLVAAAIGIAIGLAIGISPRIDTFSSSSIEFARAIPAVALVPVAILIFGFDLRAELLVVVFAATWPVLVNTAAAVRMVPQQLDDTARTLQLGRLERVTKVVLPAAAPRIFVGLRLALATAVTLMAVAEMTGNPDGIGNELVLAQSSLRPDVAMLYTLTIGALGVVLNAMLLLAGRLPGLRTVLLGGPS